MSQESVEPIRFTTGFLLNSNLTEVSPSITTTVLTASHVPPSSSPNRRRKSGSRKRSALLQDADLYDISKESPLYRPHSTPNINVGRNKYSTSLDTRGYIPVYEYNINEHPIMWDRETGFVHFTGIWKALGKNKADIAKLVDTHPDLASEIKKVRGGFLKIQGTWMPFESALELARRTCYELREELVPIFGINFPSQALDPTQPGFGVLVLSDEAAQKKRLRRKPKDPRISVGTTGNNITRTPITATTTTNIPRTPIPAASTIIPNTNTKKPTLKILMNSRESLVKPKDKMEQKSLPSISHLMNPIDQLTDAPIIPAIISNPPTIPNNMVDPTLSVTIPNSVIDPMLLGLGPVNEIGSIPLNREILIDPMLLALGSNGENNSPSFIPMTLQGSDINNRGNHLEHNYQDGYLPSEYRSKARNISALLNEEDGDFHRDVNKKNLSSHNEWDDYFKNVTSQKRSNSHFEFDSQEGSSDTHASKRRKNITNDAFQDLQWDESNNSPVSALGSEDYVSHYEFAPGSLDSMAGGQQNQDQSSAPYRLAEVDEVISLSSGGSTSQRVTRKKINRNRCCDSSLGCSLSPEHPPNAPVPAPLFEADLHQLIEASTILQKMSRDNSFVAGSSVSWPRTFVLENQEFQFVGCNYRVVRYW